MSSISSFEIINAVIPDPYILFWIAASAFETLADNLNCYKTFLANGGSTFFINQLSLMV